MPFTIIRNDITKVQADAIVNSANPQPVVGGGAESAIYAAAGPKLLAARQKIGVLKTGEAALTKAYDLPAKYIIHTVGPVWQGGEHKERELLRQCYLNSLALAAKRRCRSVAFPLISSGVYGFPRGEAMGIAMSAIAEFLLENEMTVYLVVYDEASFVISEKLFQRVQSYIDADEVRQQDAERILRRRRKAMEDFSAFAVRGNSPEDTLAFNAIEPDIAPGYGGSTEKARPAPPAPAQEYMPMPVMAAASAPAKKPKTKKRSLDDLLSNLGESFSDMLLRLIDEKGREDVEVYKRANVDRKLFSKIKKGDGYHPKKSTVLAFVIALELNLDEAKDLLSSAGYALSPGSRTDLIVQFFIEEENYDIFELNEVLFAFVEPTIGA